MTHDELTKLIQDEFREIIELRATKGKDYSGGNDALDNFKRNAKALGLSPEVVWAVYASKHWDAIQTYCRDLEVKSEPIEMRLRDLIVYSFLLMAMVREREHHTMLSEIDQGDAD